MQFRQLWERVQRNLRVRRSPAHGPVAPRQPLPLKRLQVQGFARRTRKAAGGHYIALLGLLAVALGLVGLAGAG